MTCDVDLQFVTSHTHAKTQVKGHFVQEIEWKQTDGHDRVQIPSRSVNVRLLTAGPEYADARIAIEFPKKQQPQKKQMQNPRASIQR